MNAVARSTALPPFQDRKGYSNTYSFGSAHRAGVNMLYCDGAVRHVMFHVEPTIHQAAGSRR